MTDAPRYSPTARWLHWITAILILAIAVLGVWITQFEPADEQFKYLLYNIHESLGVITFFVVLFRFAWRQVSPPPPLPYETSEIVQTVSRTAHLALYALILIQPVIGFIGTNAWGFPLSLFYILPLPAPIGQNVPVAELMSALHWWSAMGIAGLLALHIGAVIVHTYIWKDGLLKRMT